jgi:hypothetical protein
MQRSTTLRIALAAFAVAVSAATTPARAEVFYSWVDLTQKAKLGTQSDLPMRKQLCARSEVDGSCLDGGPTNKSKLLEPLPPPEETAPPVPPELDPLPPPVSGPLPLAPIAAVPTVSAVPEPSSLALLAVLGLIGGFAAGRRRKAEQSI